MFVYLMFFIFEISAGVTEFPCKFPCPWRNKTFKIYNTDGRNVFDFSFSGDGQTNNITLFGSLLQQQQCYQITERFIITRNKDSDSFQCYGIFYDIESPLKFPFETKGSVELRNQTGELADTCAVCRGDGGVSEAVALGAEPTSPPVKSVACNLPSTCTPGTGTVCNMSDNIPQGCPVATTESPTTTTEQTTTITEATTTITEPTTTITEPTTTITEPTTTITEPTTTITEPTTTITEPTTTITEPTTTITEATTTITEPTTTITEPTTTITEPTTTITEPTTTITEPTTTITEPTTNN
ncbi:unnamed protein product [Mytilus coruscus]|uniref:Uncharacterized protein n=1 Tax=Mytilus coruscus TaxID=42192 RepID=A0A6J8DLN5_MYTCO|nr:unnamed protein product [Mytilus coruscus]CAC5408494.1 unnamed protein product [Mytilus coruscus]